jgi:putative tricarboxylic transport membrane protein
MASGTDPVPHPAHRRLVRAPRDLAAGLALLAAALVALWAGAGLDQGTLRAVGPGMLPRAFALLVGASGAALAVASFLRDGEALGRWPMRGPLLLTLGVVAFALTIRSAGLAVAGPLVVMIGGSASPDARPRELAVLAVVLTAFCTGLFRYALGLPIPILALPGLPRL